MKQHFKRSAAWLLCFALLIGLFAGVPGIVNHVHAEENDPKVETIVAENNLLGNYNNSFEDYSILGWNFQSGVALSKEQTNAGSTYSLKINVKDAFATSDAAPARVAWPYTASVQVMGEGKISIVFYDAQNAVISESAASVSAASDAWQTLSVTATAPAKTAYVAVKLAGATANAVYFDDVSLIADDLNDELTIPNGDFAERLNGWEHVSSKPAGTTYSFVKEESNIYAKIDVNASKFDYTSMKVEVTPGMYYVFSLDIKNTDGLWNALYVEFFDDKDATSSKRIGSASQVGNQIASDEWTTISVQAKAPEGAKYAWIRMHANVNQTGTMSIDNARVAYNNDWYNGEMEGSYTNIGLPMGYTRSSDVVDEYTTKDPACVYAGEQAFYIDNNTWYYTYYMNVVPGETYNSTYYLKTSEEAASGWKGPLYNRIYFYDAAGKQISQLDKTTTKVTAQWTTLTNTQVAPEGAAYARVMFLSNQSKLVYVDNGTFTRTGYTNLVKTNANFDSPLTMVGNSYIPNWTLNVSAETEVVYDSPEHGYVGHIKDYGRQVWIYSQRFPVTAGDKYTASALLNGVAGYAQLYIRFYKDATGSAYVTAPENRGYASTDYLTAEDGWVPLDDYNSYIKDGKITLTTPEGANYVGILIVLQPLKDEAGEYTDVEMSIDEISLIKVCDHDFTGEPEATEASCTADGIAVYTCPDCGATKTVKTPALAHTFVDGVCSGCGRIDIQQVVTELPALGVVAGFKEYVGREWKSVLDLPATVDVALSNDTTAAVAVEWDYAPLGDMTEEGRYVLTGKLVDHEYANAENLTAQQVIYITEKNNMFINGDAENGKTGWASGHSLTTIEYPAGSGNHVLKAYSATIVNGRQFFYQSADQQTGMVERIAAYGYGKYLVSFNIMAGDYDASTPAREDLSFIFTQRYYKPGASSSTVALKSYTLSVAPGEWTSFAQMYDVTSDWTKLLTEFKVSTSNAGVPAAYYIDNIEMIPLRVVLNDLPVNIESVQTETTPLQIVVGYDKYVGANWQEALGLIQEATVIGADGGSATAAITWDYAPLGDLTTLGKYVIEGKLDSDAYTNYNDVTIKQTIVIVDKVNLATNGYFANALTGWTGGWSKSIVEYEAGNNVMFAKKSSVTASSGGTQIVSSADTADLAKRIAVNGQYYIAVDAMSAPYDADSAARDDLKVWIDLRKDSGSSTASYVTTSKMDVNATSWTTVGKVFEINNAADWTLARIDFKAQGGVADQPGAVYLDNAELILLKGEYVEVPECQHTATETVKENEVAADCTNNGSYDLVVYCATCGAEISRETITVDANGHSYDAVVTAPTCTTAGYTTYTCSVCGDSYVGNEVAALGHAWDNGVVNPAPTCTADGVKTYTCGTCGETKTEAVSAKGHTAAEAVTENATDATCTADGSYDTVVYCSVCNAELSRKTTVVPATGHSYKPEVTDPTCTAAGYTTYTCDCGHSYTADEVAALGHTASEAVKENEVAADCTNNGSYDLVVYCATCGAEISRETITVDANGHSYDAVVTAPTCTTAGYTTYTCSVCGYSYVGDKVDALGHTASEAVKENEVAADCDNAGSYDLVVYCSVCGAEISRETVTVDALGHKYDAVVTAPTCTTEGYTTYTCSVCGDSYVGDKVDALGHTASEAVKENEVAADCTNNGSYDLVVYCATCGAEISRETITVDANGHSYDAVVTAPTCTTAGYTTYTCSVCGDSYVGDKVDALGHTASEAVKENEVAADCDNAGSYDLVAYCSVCGAEISRETVTVDALGHKYDAVVTAPTCTTAGFTTYTCSVCGDSYVADETPATGHRYGGLDVHSATCTEDGYIVISCNRGCGGTWDSRYDQEAKDYLANSSWINVTAKGHSYDAVVTAPTCTTEGYTTYTCSVCGDSYVADETPATGHQYGGLKVTPATCTEDGYIIISCNRGCDCSWDSRYDQEAKDYLAKYPFINVTAKGHSYTSEITKQPTLNEEGIETFTCTVCGDSYTKPVAKLEGAVAEINGFKYATFAEAWAAVKAGDTITLLADVTINSTLVIDKAITFNGNGKTLTYTGVGADARAINVNTLGNVVIENLTIKAEKAQRAVNVIQKAVNLTLNNVDAVADNYAVNIASSAGAAKVTIINSDLVGLNTVNIASAGAVVEITDSNILCDDQTNVENYGAITLNKAAVGAKVTVTGGSITALDGSRAISNGADDATVLISESTAVNGANVQIVAIITYGDIYYYSFETIEKAAAKAQAGDTIILIADCEGNAILAPGAKLDLNGKTFKGNIVGTVEMNNGTWITPDKDYVMAGPEADYYITTDAVLTLDASGNITVEEGTLTLAQSWWTGAGQTLTIAEGATFVIPAGMNLNVLSTVIVEGNAVVEGTVTLYTADATITAAADLNVITVVKNAKVVYANGTYTVHIHVWSDATCTEAQKCACGDTNGEALGHSYDADVTAPTCTTAGYTTYTCSVCGDSYVGNEVAALGHTASEAVKENEVAADCTNAGSYDMVVYCSVCDAEISRETFDVDAIGHSYDADVTAPTCTTAGYTTYTCSVCGDSYNADEIPALGHVLIITTPMQRPTCTEDGYTMGMACITCGHEVAPEVWKATGHTFDSVTDPDCNVCGAGQVVIDLRLEFLGAPGLSFQDYVGMQALVSNTLADKYDSIYVEAVQVGPNGTTTVILEAEPYYGVYQLFNHQVLSWSMTEDVSLTLYGVKDGITYQGQTISASVEELAIAKLAAYAEAGNTKAVTALVDMLNYGAAVQTAFNYNVASLPSAGDYEGTTAAPEFNAANSITGEGTVEVLKDSISMQAKVEIQLLFAGDISAYTAKATVGGVDADVVIDTETMSAYGWTLVRVAVGAAKMRDTYTIALYDADGNAVTQTYEVSVEAYAQAQLNGDYNDVVVAMMRYGDAVSALLAPQE